MSKRFPADRVIDKFRHPFTTISKHLADQASASKSRTFRPNAFASFGPEAWMIFVSISASPNSLAFSAIILYSAVL